MFTQIRFKRTGPYGMTTLELSGPDTEVRLQLLSRLGKRERRTVIQSFLKQMNPWIRHFTNGATLNHSGDGLFRDRRDIQRKVKIPKSAPQKYLPDSIGFEIRMKRLELGLSQSTLAHQLGMRRSNLSDLERGLHYPGARTRRAITQVLALKIEGVPEPDALFESDPFSSPMSEKNPTHRKL